MFSEADVKNIFALFPPQTSSDFLPSLTLTPSGNGFATLQFVQAQFRSRVTKGGWFLIAQMLLYIAGTNMPLDTQRISLPALAEELDVDQQLVLQLVRNHPKLALFSADGLSIITADERDALYETLRKQLSNGLVSKFDFIAQHDVHVQGLDILLSDQEEELLSMHGCVCNEGYESKITQHIFHMLYDDFEDGS
jgi:hypothetical protein